MSPSKSYGGNYIFTSYLILINLTIFSVQLEISNNPASHKNILTFAFFLQTKLRQSPLE